MWWYLPPLGIQNIAKLVVVSPSGPSSCFYKLAQAPIEPQWSPQKSLSLWQIAIVMACLEFNTSLEIAVIFIMNTFSLSVLVSVPLSVCLSISLCLEEKKKLLSRGSHGKILKPTANGQLPQEWAGWQIL